MRKIKLFVIAFLLFSTAASAETIQVSVDGLVCSFCATGIEKTLTAQPAVESVKVDLDNRLVTIHTQSGNNLDDASVTKLITDSGYSVTKITRAK